MEYREGAGMVLFCQTDVTGRTESDPAAEALARNIFQYVAGWKPSPRRQAVYVGDALDLLTRYGWVVRDTGSALCHPAHVVGKHSIGNSKNVVTQALHDLFQGGLWRGFCCDS